MKIDKNKQELRILDLDPQLLHDKIDALRQVLQNDSWPDENMDRCAETCSGNLWCFQVYLERKFGVS